jgi:hypothetical protein
MSVDIRTPKVMQMYTASHTREGMISRFRDRPPPNFSLRP